MTKLLGRWKMSTIGRRNLPDRVGKKVEVFRRNDLHDQLRLEFVLVRLAFKDPSARILDVGAAKGFLMYEFKTLLPESAVRGLDVSEYAKDNSHEGMGELIDIGSADSLPYPESSFDLVISINSIHNLPLQACKTALKEIERVSRGNSFISVDAYNTEAERARLEDWILTAETWMSVPAWIELFRNTGYTGDYWWFIP